MRGVLCVALALLLAVPAASAQPVVIQMMERDRVEEADWQRAVIERFHAEQDRIRVELVASPNENARDKALAMLAAGIPPHITAGDPYSVISWGLEGIVLDLTPFLERAGSDSPFKDFYPGAMDMHNVDGRQFGIPQDLQVQAFFYAERPFDEAGIPYPDESWTWEYVAEVSPRLMKRSSADAPPQRWAMRDPQFLHWWSVIWAYGGRFFDDPKKPTRFTGDTEEMRQGLQWFYRMMHELETMPLIGRSGGSTADNLVVHENIAMAIGNSLYQQAALARATEVPWNVTYMPKGPYGNPTVSNAIGWAIIAAAGNHQEAFDVLTYFSSPDAMRLSVEMQGILVPHVPTTRDVWLPAHELPRNRHIYLETMPNTRPWPIVYGEGDASIRNNTRAYWDGKISLSQAIENMKVEVTQWIEELNY